MNSRWSAGLLALCLTLTACRSEPPPAQPPDAGNAPMIPAGSWPALPTSPAELETLLNRHTRRPVPTGTADDEITAERVLERLRLGVREQRVHGGMDAIVVELRRFLAAEKDAGRSAYLLFGTYHDSPGQLVLYRHLTGPLGLSVSLSATELFDADGHWSGARAGEQRGDDELIDRYLAAGREETLKELWRRQGQHNYTAWKYGYLRQVMDLLPARRASGSPLMGCDMPTTLQKRLRPTLAGGLERLRDLHCALALRDELAATARPHQVALLWGQNHLSSHRLPRLLPAAATVLRIYLFGHRHGQAGLEEALSQRLRLVEPLLVPIAAEQLVLLLPGPRLAASVDRVRQPMGSTIPAAERRRLTVSSTAPGELHVGGQVLTVTAAERSVQLPEGTFSWLFEGDEGSFAGGFTVRADSQHSLHFDMPRREVRSVQR